MTVEELKRALLAKAEAAIDEMLAKTPASNQITLGDIDRLAIQTGRTIQEEILASLLENSGKSEGEAPVVCAECGGVMQRKGRRRRRVVSEAGESEMERPYYYCQRCKQGSFPPG